MKNFLGIPNSKFPTLNSRFQILNSMALIIIAATFPTIVNAQSLILKSSKSVYQVGDSFSVSLVLDTKGKSINTLRGKIIVPPGKFQILDVRSGNSIISLWVEKPAVNYTTGEITFTGGVPGGFSGSNGPIFSFGVKAKSKGSASLSLDDIKLLLNDGLGTEIPGVEKISLALNIKPASAVTKPALTPAKPKEVYQPPADTTPPEDFIPLVSQHPGIADNKYFVSFFAVDKDSGIDRYEIKETPWLLPFLKYNFVKGESPYILKNQLWRTNISVRAYDQSGNYKDAFATKPFATIIIVIFAGIAALTAIAIILIFLKRWPKSSAKKSAKIKV